MFQESKELFDKSSLETDRQMKNLMKKISESESHWGKFVELLAEGNLVELLNQRGIEVQRTLMHAKSNYNKQQY